jgi:hypothetical protein
LANHLVCGLVVWRVCDERGVSMSRWTGWTAIDVAGLDAALQPMGTGRGAELHLGAIIREMKVAAGGNVSDIPGEQPWLRAQVGFLWEAAVEYVVAGMGIDEALELAFKRHMRALRVMSRQVRLERDGIHMTPDAIEGRALLSWKATWRGAGKAGYGATDHEEGLRDFEDNFWHWMVAEKAYAAAAQVAGLLPEGDATCRFEVLWVRGTYRGAGGPLALATEVTWSEAELRSNWDVVLKNAARCLTVREEYR